jgi:16S rRNA (guanine(966)-N(2))-methyltransferase RsmD
MRVIAGEYRSRALKSLPGLDVRPTPDRLRESLFNILAPRLEGKSFADVYAGTGAVGIEALSRGAKSAIFVEPKRAALQTIRENLRSLGAEGRADVRQGRAVASLQLIRADIVFVDPPYDQEKEYAVILEALGGRAMHTAKELVIAQHPQRLKLAEQYGVLKRSRVVKQGDNLLTFYEPHRPQSGMLGSSAATVVAHAEGEQDSIKEEVGIENMSDFAKPETKPAFEIHPAQPSDVPAIMHLVRQLAEYEKLTHLVVATEADFGRALFGPRPFAEALVAFVEGSAVAFALFFHNFSTFLGKPGIYLEDIYVEPQHRGAGIGKALLTKVARIAKDRDCGRMEWSVLDWNQPAIDFYQRLGADLLPDWRICRATGDALNRLAESSGHKA